MTVTVFDKVREALEPFAKIADQYDAADQRRLSDYRDEGRPAGPPHADYHRVSVELGECRRALEALASLVSTEVEDVEAIATVREGPVDELEDGRLERLSVTPSPESSS
jgi:hypothetical protein